MPGVAVVLRSGLLAGLLMLGLAPLRVARAQSDVLDADCPPAPDVPAPSTGACIVLDARKSVDSLAGPLIFRWRMGDGQVREGLQFEYCYAARGRYVIQLDVVDKRTGRVREHETERVVDFRAMPAVLPDPVLRFTAPARAKVGEAVSFSLDETTLPACLPPTVGINWNFRDGLLGQGRSVTHAFRRAGTFVVRAAIDGSGVRADCLPRICVTRTIVIEP